MQSADADKAGVKFQVSEDAAGCLWRYQHPNGQWFEEYRTHARLFGWPLLHRTSGIDPRSGRHLTARGWIAIGRKAVGGVAIGQLAVGGVAIGQAAIGLLFGGGQLATGVVALGQAGFGLGLGVGQLSSGWLAVGQLAFGHIVLAQLGFGLGEGAAVVQQSGADPRAVAFLLDLWHWLRGGG